MGKEICGFELDNGKKCKNEATEGERCWIDSHKGTAGRPSKIYDDWRREKIIETAKKPVPKKVIAMAGAIHPRTLNDWLSREDEGGVFEQFSQKFKRARAEAGKELSEMAMLDGDALKLLQISFDIPDPKEKVEKKQEISGPNGRPIEYEKRREIDRSDLSEDTRKEIAEKLKDIDE